jgi:cytochrome P450
MERGAVAVTEQGVAWPRWEDNAFYTQPLETVFASIEAQRRTAPVHYYEPPSGFATGFWVLSKWEHQRFVGSHPELFSSKYGFAVGDASEPSTVLHNLPAWAQERINSGTLSPAEIRATISGGKLSMGDPNFVSLILSDPPVHGEIRNIMMKALRPSLVRSLKSRMAEITEEFLDEVKPGTVTDFVTTIGQIPAALMTELIGVPRDMRNTFIEMASAQMQAITIDPNRTPEEAERIKREAANFYAYCDELLERRQTEGADNDDDLVSAIARSQWNGGPVPHGLAISFIHTFVNAGETTRALLSFIAMFLAEYPDERRKLAADPALAANAIEESLRWCPLNWTGCRTAVEDIEIGGQQVKAGDYVVMAYASANRDEDIWDRPNVYDITRTFEHDHQSFGYGEHSCPGALLARTDSTVILERMIQRFPDWEIAGEPIRWANPFIQGMASLPLTFSA